MSPHVGLDGNVPNAFWNSVKPNVSNLRVFGCRAWLAIHQHERKKLDPKGLPYIFVGYDHQAKAYRL